MCSRYKCHRLFGVLQVLVSCVKLCVVGIGTCIMRYMVCCRYWYPVLRGVLQVLVSCIKWCVVRIGIMCYMVCCCYQYHWLYCVLQVLVSCVILCVVGIGISMVLASTLVGIYYNMVNAWAFHYLFSSMMATLPWLTCSNPWNQDSEYLYDRH